MQVEGNGNRDIGSDNGAKLLQQFTFGVVVIFRGHGAVQVDQDPVKRALCFCRFQDRAGTGIPGIPRDGAGRRCPGDNGAYQFPVILFCRLFDARRLDTGALDGGGHVVTIGEQIILEIAEPGRQL